MDACCFTGHRRIPPALSGDIQKKLVQTIDWLYSEKHITTYYAGGAQGFDTLASEAVIECRKDISALRLVVVMPHAEQAARWSAEDRARHKRITDAADEVVCLAEHYYRGCMQRRNRYLVDHSDVCVCYLTEQTGGTAYTVGYAQKKSLPIWNLASHCNMIQDRGCTKCPLSLFR